MDNILGASLLGVQGYILVPNVFIPNLCSGMTLIAGNLEFDCPQSFHHGAIAEYHVYI